MRRRSSSSRKSGERTSAVRSRRGGVPRRTGRTPSCRKRADAHLAQDRLAALAPSPGGKEVSSRKARMLSKGKLPEDDAPGEVASPIRARRCIGRSVTSAPFSRTRFVGADQAHHVEESSSSRAVGASRPTSPMRLEETPLTTSRGGTACAVLHARDFFLHGPPPPMRMGALSARSGRSLR